MPIWRTPGVDSQPVLTLVRWRVLQVAEGPTKGQQHLCGYCTENYEGRCSTAIVAIDRESRRCTTRSGRVYELRGRPAYDSDGQYVWQSWTGGVATIDVTDDVFGVVSPGWPRVQDLPTEEQEPFSAWLSGQPVPIQGGYFLGDYVRWKESSRSDD